MQDYCDPNKTKKLGFLEYSNNFTDFLGTVCCVLEGIMELEDTGGIEILSDTLKDDQASEEEKSEAAGLLAQVTSPWIENNNTIEGLSRHLNDLVQSLTSKTF